jgi:hypothetical protein
MSTLASYADIHSGETILVCGCGESLLDLQNPNRFITIGVNDVGRLFQPDYLVVVNSPQQFSNGRFEFVANSRARTIFTQLDLGITHPNVVKFKLGTFCGIDFSNPDVLHYTHNSPYVAVCLAHFMGAKRIGLIGVDFTDRHFFGPTGAHRLLPQLPAIDEQYRKLGEALRARGVDLVNLSARSRLTRLPKRDLASLQPAPKDLRIVSYATTPVAGVPEILARAITARTPHSADCVWATNGYGNGVEFEGGVEWTKSPAEATALIELADLIIVHNGKIDPAHRRLFERKPVVTMAHNYLWNVDTAFIDRGYPGVVVAQYQATLPEFSGWQPVPNPVPLWDERFQPGSKGPTIDICYTPSGAHERYPSDHRLYWHSKGFETTNRVLDLLSRRYGITAHSTRHSQISHAASLALKRQAHIAIDECVTGSYHRNSLEGLASGCVVVNGMGIRPEIMDMFRSCSNLTGESPFVYATLETLEQTLSRLIESGCSSLQAIGARNRNWMETHWDFAEQWRQFWMPVVDRALAGKTGVSVSAPARSDGVTKMNDQVWAIEYQKGVSVVICHAGDARLPHLAASLANLRQCEAVNEIVVVEMGSRPVANKVASRWADKYVFVPNNGVFERARALNIGAGIAEFDVVLWRDNDLVMEPEFVNRAVTEMRAHSLDFLVPYTSVNYLSAADSREVMRGTRNPADCRPVRTFRSAREIQGGMGLVSTEFLTRYGGMCEEFRGWGGEDNGWWVKASLLGQASTTQRSDQLLYHLFHPDSGGYDGGAQIAKNPHYAANVALLREMRAATRDRQAFLSRFSRPDMLASAWKGKQVLFVVEPENDEAAIADCLTKAFGINVDYRIARDNDKPWLELVSGAPPDAVILSGSRVTTEFLTDLCLERFWPKTVVIKPDELPQHLPDRAGALWAPTFLSAHATPFSKAANLLGPLSIILGGFVSYPSQAFAHAGALPLWMYWEGDCPAWIRMCQQTVLAHASNVRLLSPSDFDRLRDIDRDIDLGRLGAAHRADFIRAFLLARYGGLWVDSDCIAMQPLDSILECLADYDFVAHRERSGMISNGFIGARRGSEIASALYARLCVTLRSGRPIGWISLGGEPLTDILNHTSVRWRELPCDAVQPICWSTPGEFFVVREPQEHDLLIQKSAICYMLSNVAVQRFRAENAGADLLAENTFFRHLLAQSLREPDPVAANDRPVTVRPGQQLPFWLDALADVSPNTILDCSADSGRWGVMVREFQEEPGNGPGEWKIRMDAVERAEATIAPHRRIFYNDVRTSSHGSENGCRWNLIILGAGFGNQSKTEAAAALERSLQSADYVFASASINTDHAGANGSVANWSLSEILTWRPVRYEVKGERYGVSQGAFLFSSNDPKGLSKPTLAEEVFTHAMNLYRKVGDESVSGPGASLVHTAEIRQRLPMLLADLGVTSFLDAACGDLNWIKHVALGVDEYIGVDILSAVVAQNKERFAGSRRRFLNLDISQQVPPRADLIFCRDCLVHLPYADIFRVLRNFKRSKSIYLLTTTFVNRTENTDITTGAWRPLNLSCPPFFFAEPLRILNEKCRENAGKYSDKSLGLWKLDSIIRQ